MSTPFGRWPSPLSPALVAAGSTAMGFPRIVGEVIHWVERRPHDGGRITIVRLGSSGPEDVTQPRFNATTHITGYGGDAYTVSGDTVFAVRGEDQRVCAIRGSAVTPLTPDDGSLYGDLSITPDGRHVIGVRETADGCEVVAIPVSGGAVITLAGGHEFVISPRLSPDGRTLAWVSWDQPQMPWDGTSLWTAPLDGLTLGEPRLVAGSLEESVIQPAWSARGVLHFVTDRSGWWNICRLDGDVVSPLAPMQAESGDAPWGVGARSYAILDDGTIAMRWSVDGLHRIGFLAPGGALREVETGYTTFHTPVALGTDVVVLAAGPTGSRRLVRISPEGDVHVVADPPTELLPSAYVSQAQPVSFPTTDGDTAHALYYPPRNPGVEAPVDERPPLIVTAHGGPTGAAHGGLDLGVQFWTTRGFAVVDVNYRGSTGYGRAYRNKLRGQWGVYDVDDCVAAAKHLVRLGLADPARLVIRGGSAGGWTALCAVAHRSVFASACSICGISDAARFARETHRYERHYVDGLIGPLPECQADYDGRSALSALEDISTPTLLLQGADDSLVPPHQSELVAAALERNGVLHDYVVYAGEGHGFRAATAIEHSLATELAFHRQALRIAGSAE